MDKNRMLDMLEAIHPANLDYEQWLNVGMAIQHEGGSWIDWDNWSQRDPDRYHKGECESKWRSFHGSATPVTGGTLYQMAVDAGWMDPDTIGIPLDWELSLNGIIDERVIDIAWVQSEDIEEPKTWSPAEQIREYLSTLYNADEYVGYVTDAWQQEDSDRWLPKKGAYDRTAGELLSQLAQHPDDIGAVFGDYNREAGAWIRFNPLDGRGVKDENVTSFRYALVESDSVSTGKQLGIIKELELPCALIVYSGGKSVHAIVRIDASTLSEYRKRVDYLYAVCEKNGLKIDKNNRNPSRLSRFPGFERGNKKQYIICKDIGQPSFEFWKDHIESIKDDLPEIDNASMIFDNALPDLAPELIAGVLREGHKLLIVGPSKAGKSFALIELAVAIAEGLPWLGHQCSQGKVLYINLELDRISCMHRFKDVYSHMAPLGNHEMNIDIWNLRGHSVPMDKLAPMLIRRAKKKGYKAVILDPIYKVIMGDENSAEQVAKFCNEFDRIATELSCAVIYCHHHSKGEQSQKRSAERASGSGVFSRDPDAIIDMMQLHISEDKQLSIIGDKQKKIREAYLRGHVPDYTAKVTADDEASSILMAQKCNELLSPETLAECLGECERAAQRIQAMTAWRLSYTLREFPPMKDTNLWFDYPLHIDDIKGFLKGAMTADEKAQKDHARDMRDKWKERAQEQRQAKDETLSQVFDDVQENGIATISVLAEAMCVDERTVKRYLDRGPYVRKNGLVWRKKKEEG